MRLRDIASVAGYPASTVLRLLNTLLSLGYVIQGEDNRYALSLKFTQLGTMISSQTDLHEIVHPYLVELSRVCQESSCLAVEREMKAVYIDVVNGPDNMLKAMQYIGKSAPLHCTGVGKLLLTNFTQSQIDAYIEQKGLKPFTANTIRTREALLEELAAIPRYGYALDDEECEIGARCIAAPIYNYTQRIVAAISVSGPTTRMNVKQIDNIKPLILRIAEEISSTLAWDKHAARQDKKGEKIS